MFQAPIHPESTRSYLRFALNGTVFQFKVQYFDLLTAPQVFTKVFMLVTSWARQWGHSSLSLSRWLACCGRFFTLPVGPPLLSHNIVRTWDLCKLEEVSLPAETLGSAPRNAGGYHPGEGLLIRLPDLKIPGCSNYWGCDRPQPRGSLSYTATHMRRSIQKVGPFAPSCFFLDLWLRHRI